VHTSVRKSAIRSIQRELFAHQLDPLDLYQFRVALRRGNQSP